jgi:large subunit ribosomal protein L22
MTAAEPQVAARATARYLHVSPYKVRQVLELVRGLPVEDAERILKLSEKDAADDVAKVLGSAMANAEHNLALEPEELFVARAWADEGPTRKWGQPRARGRYFRVRKRTTHLTIILERFETEELEERRRREESTGRGGAVAQRRRAERVRRSRQTEEAETADDEAIEQEENIEDEHELEVEAATTETAEAEAPEAAEEEEE